MMLPDVNVLVYAHREDAPGHEPCHDWLVSLARSEEAFGLSDLVLSGFIRVVTHPRVFSPPSPLDAALEFVTQLRELPNAVAVGPGPRHWGLFLDLWRRASARRSRRACPITWSRRRSSSSNRCP